MVLIISLSTHCLQYWSQLDMGTMWECCAAARCKIRALEYFFSWLADMGSIVNFFPSLFYKAPSLSYCLFPLIRHYCNWIFWWLGAEALVPSDLLWKQMTEVCYSNSVLDKKKQSCVVGSSLASHGTAGLTLAITVTKMLNARVRKSSLSLQQSNCLPSRCVCRIYHFDNWLYNYQSLLKTSLSVITLRQSGVIPKEPKKLYQNHLMCFVVQRVSVF